jgi:hypothetical protein
MYLYFSDTPRIKNELIMGWQIMMWSAGDDIAKKVALNGDEWAKLLKKARAHKELSSQ